MLYEALEYALKQWEIFPLVPRQKRPLTAHGFEDATSNPEQIERWWRATPDANIGLRLPEGTICIDVDPRNGGSLDALGELPETLTARTGGDGWHLLFRYHGKPGGKVRGVPGVDVKTRKGYIVAAPSIHPSGGRYEWTCFAPVAPLTARLAQMLQAPKPPARPAPAISGASTGRANAWLRFVAEAPQGERNSRLYWAACRAAENDAPASVWNDLATTGAAIGLAESEIRGTLDSAKRGVARV